MKKTNTASRLKELMNDRHLRQVDILDLCAPYARQYGVKMNKSDISQYVSGKVTPNQDKLFILSKALNVSETWLMGYEFVENLRIMDCNDLVSKTLNSMRNMNRSGQEIVADYAESLDLSGKYKADGEVTEYIETYSVARAAAGNGSYNGQYDEPTYHLIRTEQNIKHDAIIDVVGESMTPTIHNGDIAFIVHTFDRVDGQIYAVNLDDETVIKRCYFEANRLILSSDNPDVEDRIIKGSDLETVRIVGRVVGWTTPEV